MITLLLPLLITLFDCALFAILASRCFLLLGQFSDSLEDAVKAIAISDLHVGISAVYYYATVACKNLDRFVEAENFIKKGIKMLQLYKQIKPELQASLDSFKELQKEILELKSAGCAGLL